MATLDVDFLQISTFLDDYVAIGCFGFWPKTSEKSFGFGQNLKNPRKRQV